MLSSSNFVCLLRSVWIFVLLSVPANAIESCSSHDFGFSTPDEQGIDEGNLLALTKYVKDNELPILSFLVSRNGKIVYEMYTSHIEREESHYLMSVTKSVTSALMGIALDHSLIKDINSSVSDNLPLSIFNNIENYRKFGSVTIKDVMGMSALDAQVAPHLQTQEAVQRLHDFVNSTNRLDFALHQKILPHIGKDFQYNDITPMLAGGIIQYASKSSLLDFAKKMLFDPMEFRNVEWMHQDQTGFDNAAYGLRLRPIDMQKFGLLFMDQGCWAGHQLISKDWVSTSFSPWIKSWNGARAPNYGWYWWNDRFISNWTGHTANGWKGQRITIIPEKGIVITMTGIVENANEEDLYERLVNRFVIPSVENFDYAKTMSKSEESQLSLSVKEINKVNMLSKSSTEYRMIPQTKAKNQHIQFNIPEN